MENIIGSYEINDFFNLYFKYYVLCNIKCYEIIILFKIIKFLVIMLVFLKNNFLRKVCFFFIFRRLVK